MMVLIGMLFVFGVVMMVCFGPEMVVRLGGRPRHYRKRVRVTSGSLALRRHPRPGTRMGPY